MKFLFGLFLLPGLIVGLTIHEAAHALSAKWLGDRNPERMGRISLNPFRHLSALGTLAIFLLGFGWGKPVEVNLYNFRRPKLYFLLSSLAGPISNLLLCILSLGCMYGFTWLLKFESIRSFNRIPFIVIYGAAMSCYLVNGMLAVVNLLPIPPLDGSKIWPCVIPKMRPTLSGKWSSVSTVVLVVAMMTGIVSKVLGPPIMWMQGLMPHSAYTSMRLNFPVFMDVPSEAQECRYSKEPSGSDDPNSLICYFKVQDVYPVKKTTEFYDLLLAQHGWAKLSYDLEYPCEMAKGWQKSSEECDPEHSVTSWLYRQFWVNEDDETIKLVFRLYYEEPPIENQPINVEVWLVWYCNDIRMRILTEDYREIHQDETVSDPNVILMVEGNQVN